jgi:hypothetical protein
LAWRTFLVGLLVIGLANINNKNKDLQQKAQLPSEFLAELKWGRVGHINP